MGSKNARFATPLSVWECAELFRAKALESGGFAAKVGGALQGGRSGTFYTRADSPFSVLDDDPPAFGVGIDVPMLSSKSATALHMYVWERGDHRVVELHAAHSWGSGGHAKLLIDGVTSAFEGRRLAPDGELPPEIYAHVRAGRKIEAIKVYRAHTGASLKEAKKVIDSI